MPEKGLRSAIRQSRCGGTIHNRRFGESVGSAAFRRAGDTHLLEHVEDEGRALAELHRIMRNGGWGILLAPVDLSRETTDEDDGTATPAERTRRFGQYDHHRAYGRDYAERLRKAGFVVEDADYSATLPTDERKRNALCDDHIYIVRKQRN